MNEYFPSPDTPITGSEDPASIEVDPAIPPTKDIANYKKVTIDPITEDERNELRAAARPKQHEGLGRPSHQAAIDRTPRVGNTPFNEGGKRRRS